MNVAAAARGLALDPKDTEALYARANALRDSTQFTKALADYTAVLKLDFAHVRALAGRGRTYHSMREYDKAIATFNPSTWRLDRDQLVLTGRGGSWRFAESDATVWERFPLSVDPMLLVRQ